MESLPEDVIASILPRVGDARDVVIASVASPRWRVAFRNYNLTLSFNYKDWPNYSNITPNQLENIITQTVFQTTVLQCLSISMDKVVKFSADRVIAWLTHVRATLQKLQYNFRTTTNININAEVGGLSFPALKSIYLSYVSISALDLSRLITACPNIKDFTLIKPKLAALHARVIMELSSNSLMCVCIERVTLDRFVLEADRIERLHVASSNIENFQLISNGGLKDLTINNVGYGSFDIGMNNMHLEVIDIDSFTLMWSIFFPMILRSATLRRLRLWNVEVLDDPVNVNDIAAQFSQLSHLSLCYHLDEPVNIVSEGPRFKNVVVLELGWLDPNAFFTQLVTVLVRRCPILRSLFIHRADYDHLSDEQFDIVDNAIDSITQLLGKYPHIDMQFISYK